VKFDGRPEVMQSVDDSGGSGNKRGDGTFEHERAHPAGCDLDAEQRGLPEVLGGREDRPAVRRPTDRAWRAIPVGGQLSRSAVRPRFQSDPKAVRLVAGTFHGEPSHGLAIGRKGWLRIPGGVLGGQVPWGDLPVCRGQEKVEVRRPRFLASGVARREDHPSAVGCEGKLLGATERFRGGVRVHVFHDVHHRTIGEGQHEQVISAAVLPTVPMPDEDPVEDQPGRLACVVLCEAGGGFVHGQAGEDFGAEGEGLAIGGDDEVTEVQREGCDRHGFAAGKGEVPNLAGAGSGRKEIDRAAVRRPRGVRIAGGMGGQPAQSGAVDANEPEIEASLVGLQIVRAQRERDVVTLRGNDGIGDALHRPEVVCTERVGFCAEPGQGQQEECGKPPCPANRGAFGSEGSGRAGTHPESGQMGNGRRLHVGFCGFLVGPRQSSLRH